LPGPHRRHGKNEKNFAYAYRPSITVHGVCTLQCIHIMLHYIIIIRRIQAERLCYLYNASGDFEK
jgi:hypothetical protein